MNTLTDSELAEQYRAEAIRHRQSALGLETAAFFEELAQAAELGREHLVTGRGLFTPRHLTMVTPSLALRTMARWYEH